MSIASTTTMKPTQVLEALRTLVAIQQPAMIWGPPGVGKSAVTKQLAAELNVELRDVRAILLDPVDLRGLPHINGDGRAHWAVPEFLPREGKGILFLDELTAAPQLTQAACYQLILDRKLGEYELPDGWTIIAAGNRESDRGVVHRMPSPLTNRFVHLDFGVDLDDWTKWATTHGIATEVIAFLRFRDELLHDFDPKRSEKAFPTPRSWEFVSNIVGSGTVTNGIEYPLIAGAVGEGAAAEFMGFLKIARSLQSPDMILMNPDSAAVPEEAATLYAVSTALARKATEGNMDRVVAYANRLPDEFSVLLVKDALDRDPAVAHTRSYIEWVAKHHEVMS